jgi:hypothetical protein
LPKKVVVFDLDETIGSFRDLYELWCHLHARRGFPPKGADEPIFHELLSLYPEMFRVGLFAILDFLNEKFQQKECYPIHIYTNTQCNAPRWVDMILSYLQKQVVGDDTTNALFTRPICAFKIDGKRVEPERTTHSKCPSDLIRCSLLPKNVEICFIDDQPHPRMQTGKIYFIQPPPYYHALTREEIMRRFSHSIVYSLYFPMTKNHVSLMIPRTFMEPDPAEVHIGQKILYYVREFFLVDYCGDPTNNKPKTRRSTHRAMSSTMKIVYN